MRENRTSGSGQGAPGNRRSYCERIQAIHIDHNRINGLFVQKNHMITNNFRHGDWLVVRMNLERKSDG